MHNEASQKLENSKVSSVLRNYSRSFRNLLIMQHNSYLDEHENSKFDWHYQPVGSGFYYLNSTAVSVDETLILNTYHHCLPLMWHTLNLQQDKIVSVYLRSNQNCILSERAIIYDKIDIKRIMSYNPIIWPIPAAVVVLVDVVLVALTAAAVDAAAELGCQKKKQNQESATSSTE
jgi:hypothetical protein